MAGVFALNRLSALLPECLKLFVMLAGPYLNPGALL